METGKHAKSFPSEYTMSRQGRKRKLNDEIAETVTQDYINNVMAGPQAVEVVAGGDDNINFDEAINMVCNFFKSIHYFLVFSLLLLFASHYCVKQS